MKVMKPWELTTHLWCVLQSIYDEATPELAEIKLNPRSFFLLSRLEEYPNPAKISEILYLPPPTVTFIVKQLEVCGYIGRATDKKDLRKFHLTLTESGKAALGKGKECVGRIVRERMSNLSKEEVSNLGAIMGKLQEH
jgi:DNA-binding MarR family transcriptional regulator